MTQWERDIINLDDEWMYKEQIVFTYDMTLSLKSNHYNGYLYKQNVFHYFAGIVTIVSFVYWQSVQDFLSNKEATASQL